MVKLSFEHILDDFAREIKTLQSPDKFTEYVNARRKAVEKIIELEKIDAICAR